VRRPKVETSEGKTPAIGDHQVRDLLVAPGKETSTGEETIKEKRDRAILSMLLYHALRREERCKLTVKDFKYERRGVAHLKVSGKGQKTRYLPLNPATGPWSMNTSKPPVMALTRTGRYSVLSATTALAGSTMRSPPMVSTSWCDGTRASKRLCRWRRP
jgi:hypothetical protein